MLIMFASAPTTAHAIEAPVDVATPSETLPVSTDAPVDVDTPRPPTTANDFFPEDRDLTSCIGVLERPGCGSEARGGWRQGLILLAVLGGLTIVFGNVVRSARKRNS
ncbi:MAG: hypothetical protein ACI83Y_000897 [Candidatus Azotimanducaceae bacterium]|jgi:hypothetical protein